MNQPLFFTYDDLPIEGLYALTEAEPENWQARRDYARWILSAEVCWDEAHVFTTLSDIYAAHPDDAVTLNALGLVYELGIATAVDKERAGALFFEAASQGYARGEYNYGRLLSDKTYGDRHDRVEGIKWIAKAADHGFAPAQFSYGCALWEGDGVKQDKGEAVKWSFKAAEQGVVQAQVAYGGVLLEGEILPRDVVNGCKWLSRAAAKGNQGARAMLGHMKTIHEEGNSPFRPDEVEGIKAANLFWLQL